MKRISLFLTEKQYAVLQQLRQRTGVPQAQWLRWCLDASLQATGMANTPHTQRAQDALSQLAHLRALWLHGRTVAGEQGTNGPGDPGDAGPSPHSDSAMHKPHAGME